MALLHPNDELAYFGGIGSFSHEVAERCFAGKKHHSFETFEEVIESVLHRDCAAGIVPIENSNSQTIIAAQVALAEKAGMIYVTALIPHKVELCLYSYGQLEEITEVRSFEPVFGQTDLWLKENLPNAARTRTQASTSGAVASLAKDPATKSAAAIGSKGATVHGVPCVREQIQTQPNVTIFCVLCKDRPAKAEHLLFVTKDFKTEIVSEMHKVALAHGCRISSNWEVKRYPHHFGFFEISSAYGPRDILKDDPGMEARLKNTSLVGGYSGKSLTETILEKHQLP